MFKRAGGRQRTPARVERWTRETEREKLNVAATQLLSSSRARQREWRKHASLLADYRKQPANREEVEVGEGSSGETREGQNYATPPDAHKPAPHTPRSQSGGHPSASTAGGCFSGAVTHHVWSPFWQVADNLLPLLFLRHRSSRMADPLSRLHSEKCLLSEHAVASALLPEIRFARTVVAGPSAASASLMAAC